MLRQLWEQQPENISLYEDFYLAHIVPILRKKETITESNITADFIVDALEELWPQLKEKYAPHTLVLNLDNGPENSSRRSQFMNRLVKFAFKHSVNISLAYYPPYHSKYNMILRNMIKRIEATKT